jgi:hypothetical protein
VNFEPPQGACDLLQLYSMRAWYTASVSSWCIEPNSGAGPHVFVRGAAPIEVWVAAVKRLEGRLRR